MIIGCPRIMRADNGTENCSVAKIHIAMRQFHDDWRSGDRSFIYGPSTSNIVMSWINTFKLTLYTLLQRVESFWAQWRRFVGDWWMTLFRVYYSYNYMVAWFSSKKLLYFQTLMENGFFDRANLIHQWVNCCEFGSDNCDWYKVYIGTHYNMCVDCCWKKM